MENDGQGRFERIFSAAWIVFLTMSVLALTAFLSGCAVTGETIRKMSDDLGDKALQAHALVDIWKVESSDASANGSPTGKKITVIGDVKSIPLVTKDGETVKDYAEYRNTETPAWYNSSNVTKEEVFIGTGDNAKEVIQFLKWKKDQTEKSESVKQDSTDSGSEGSSASSVPNDASKSGD